MANTISYLQIFLSSLLLILILLQSRGTGFSRSFYLSSFSRRGLEKLVFRLTFIVTALFIAVSILRLYL